MAMRLDHQIAIVTGAGQGIGREIALRLGEEGATVVIADINEKGSAETAELIAKNGGPRAIVIPTDITHEDQVMAMIKDTLAIDQRIDILVNNSGIAGPIQNIEDIPLEEWEATMAVNLRGMFLCCKHAVPVMKRQKKGNIINISSLTGKRPLAQRTPYATTKMGVIGFTRTLATEVGQWDIRVNTICPGEVISQRLDMVLDGIARYTGKTREQVNAERVEASPLKTFVPPKYVAAVVAFLCSEDAAMMTGQDINVTAGLIMY
jgi:NAD(P)-dependent dehydrogenase (short-subunit alcohol dehydrogenase family)